MQKSVRHKKTWKISAIYCKSEKQEVAKTNINATKIKVSRITLKIFFGGISIWKWKIK